ncbi:AI-2E family transporter [Pedobacter changchengzhani]|uniref:AI-2E family transporter n=1 Tax=Pedobacter changchengzhani TaxID=2529274 RepID=A0A4V3A028_9SPHI|nr:AI-2E family transporter [Pedobacter changchengzhani]TDG35993.1 AI-2E family transporter [Pedobacter changchengzhani]
MKDKLSFLPKLALVLFCLISITYILILGQSLLAPLFFSFLMAILLLPVANYLEQRFRFKRSFSTIVSVILMIAVIGSILYFFANQISDLWADWPLLKNKANVSFHELQHWISSTFNVNAEKQLSYLNDSTEKALATSAAIVATTLATLSSTLMFLGFTLLFTFFILNYRRKLFTFLVSVFKEDYKEKVGEIVSQIQYIIKKYIIGLFLQMLIVTTLLMTILSIMGVKYAILLGLVAGIFNVVPYLGIFFALLISCLITFATAGAGKVLLVLFAFIGVHAIDGNILMPLVVGSKVKINALIAFIGIVVGEMIWGISGMFLCIPYLAVAKIIFDRVDNLKPWGILMGEGHKPEKKRRVYRITKKIKLEEQE